MEKHFKTAGLILRPHTNLSDIYKKLSSILSSIDIDLLIEEQSAKTLGLKGLGFCELCKKADFLISLGGDGTLLHTARSCYEHELPILGINAGNLGFLTLVRLDEMERFFKEFDAKNFGIEERMMFEVHFSKHGKCITKDIVFNDVVFARQPNSAMIKVDALKDKKLFNSYYGDGVIVSTPTGSTAYNLSAGGALLHPLLDGFILTSVCPHSLTQRPLVMPSTFELEFKSTNCEVVIDGQNHYKMSEFDSVLVKKAKKSAKLFTQESRDYFDILREKLNWGNV